MPAQTNKLPSIKDVSSSAWEKLAQKKIYFGHQSVGFNIIDGIKDVMKENPQIRINIVETSNPADFSKGVFAHSRVGKNVDPKSKVEAFYENIVNGLGEKADVAFLKFCYVDITKVSDIEDIFQTYQKAMSHLMKRDPNVKFVHLTVPLTVSQRNWKTWLKEKLGKGELWEYTDNIKRNKYNEMLIKNYEGREPIFDLAGLESTFKDSSRSSFSAEGRIYYSLAPEYTYDGGHLNELGRKSVAEQFLIFLANI